MKRTTCFVAMLLFAGLAICCVSCNGPNAVKEDNNQTEINSQDQEPSSTSVTITHTVSGSQKEWETSFQKGNECVGKEDIRLATFYYVNALGKDPGNMKVIQKYREVIKNAIDKSTSIEEKFSYYTALESFLQNQISTVEVGKVEQISQWLNELAAERNKLENDVVADTGSADEADEVADDSSGAFDELKSALEKLENAVRQSLEAGNSNPVYLDVASYQLQECEQIMRSIIALAPQLDKAGQDSIAVLYANLKQLGEEVVDQKSKIQWDKFYAEHQQFVAQYNALSSTNSTMTENQGAAPTENQDSTTTENQGAAPTENQDSTTTENQDAAPTENQNSTITENQNAAPTENQNSTTTENQVVAPTENQSIDGNMEKRLKLIQKEMAKLQALLPKLSEKYVGDMSIDYSKDDYSAQNASALIQKLQLWLNQTTEKQLQLYNQWAIERIKKANKDAYNATGIIANGEWGRITIGKALINNLGPIDLRYLTNELNRCYQEVLNKYLASNQLNPVKGNYSWSEAGNMGHTLLKMYEQPKVKLSQF